MNTILFCGFTRGLAALKTMVESGNRPSRVYIYPEDAWETEQRFGDIAAYCEGLGIAYTITKGGKVNVEPCDLILVVGWRSLINVDVRNAARLGAFAIHWSLLPKYRGFCPLNWAIINGEQETGATLFKLTDGADEGPVKAQDAVTIGPDDDAGTLTTKLIALEQTFISALLADPENDYVYEQIGEPTYCCWRVPTDGLLRWGQTANSLWNQVRGLTHPYPGARTLYVPEGYANLLDSKRTLYIWKAHVTPASYYLHGNDAGKVERFHPASGVNIVCGDGNLLTLERVQLEGDVERDAAEVITRLKVRLG